MVTELSTSVIARAPRHRRPPAPTRCPALASPRTRGTARLSPQPTSGSAPTVDATKRPRGRRCLLVAEPADDFGDRPLEAEAAYVDLRTLPDLRAAAIQPGQVVLVAILPTQVATVVRDGFSPDSRDAPSIRCRLFGARLAGECVIGHVPADFRQASECVIELIGPPGLAVTASAAVTEALKKGDDARCQLR